MLKAAAKANIPKQKSISVLCLPSSSSFYQRKCWIPFRLHIFKWLDTIQPITQHCFNGISISRSAWMDNRRRSCPWIFNFTALVIDKRCPTNANSSMKLGAKLLSVSPSIYLLIRMWSHYCQCWHSKADCRCEQWLLPPVVWAHTCGKIMKYSSHSPSGSRWFFDRWWGWINFGTPRIR